MQTSRAVTVSELQGLQKVRADLFRRIEARPHGDRRDLLVLQDALRGGKVSLSVSWKAASLTSMGYSKSSPKS